MQKRILYGNILILFLLFSPLPSQAQGERKVAQIDGIIDSKIDGLIDLGEKDSPIGEWGDAVLSEINLLSEQEKTPATLRSKFVSGRLLIALSVSKVIDSITVQYDLDDNGKLSLYDLRATYSYFEDYDSNKQLIAGWMLRAELFTGKTWEPVENVLQTKDDTLTATIAQISMTKGLGNTDVELALNVKLAANLLAEYDPRNTPPIAERKGTVQYGIVVEAEKQSFGYPVTPEIGAVGTYSTFSINHDITSLFNMNVGIDHIETTQAVQNPEDDLPLVLNKPTMTRVFVKVQGRLPVTVSVKLYAYNVVTIAGGSIGMPMGSISQVFQAPVSPNRSVITDSANFILPANWIDKENIMLTALVLPIDQVDVNNRDNIQTKRYTFTPVRDLNIYYLRVNTGTASNPIQPFNFTVQRLLNEIRESYPQANPNFIELDWQTIGVFNGTDHDLIGELNRLAGGIFLGILIQILAGVEPSPVPDQIYGFRTGSGGHSDPKWNNHGDKLAVVGGGGTGSMTAPHEINHNLGPNSWGRHVADTGYGCGAGGPDEIWQTLYNDDNIHALGWSPTYGIIPTTTPDMMSYCSTGTTPKSWISDYRWNAMIGLLSSTTSPLPITLANNADFMSRMMKTFREIEASEITSRIISGEISLKGASLDPSFEIDGFYDTTPVKVETQQADYYVNVLFANQSIISYPIYTKVDQSSEFVSPDHVEDLDNFEFSFYVPDNGQIIGIELVDSKFNVLDKLYGTGISTTIDAKILGEVTRNAPVEILWNYSLKNTSNIYSQLQYSPDGNMWYPIGKPTTATSMLTDFSLYPGSKNGQIRISISDGFDTLDFLPIQNLYIPNLAPELRIDRVEGGKGLNDVIKGTYFAFSASAIDPEDGEIPDTNFKWELIDPAGKSVDMAKGENTFSFRADMIGSYTLTVTTWDSNGAVDTESTKIYVDSPKYLTEAQVREFKESVLLSKSSTIPEITTTNGTATDETKVTDGKGTINESDTTTAPQLPFPIGGTLAVLVVGVLVIRRSRKK